MTRGAGWCSAIWIGFVLSLGCQGRPTPLWSELAPNACCGVGDYAEVDRAFLRSRDGNARVRLRVRSPRALIDSCGLRVEQDAYTPTPDDDFYETGQPSWWNPRSHHGVLLVSGEDECELVVLMVEGDEGQSPVAFAMFTSPTRTRE